MLRLPDQTAMWSCQNELKEREREVNSYLTWFVVHFNVVLRISVNLTSNSIEKNKKWHP